MRVKAGPDAAVTRLHASTRRPDIGGTVPYDSSLLRRCACCREQHNGANYKNIPQHSLPSFFCTPDMHGLTPGNQVGFCPTTFQLLCASGPGASGAAARGLFATSASRVTPFVTSFAACISPFVASFAALSTPFHPARLGLNIRHCQHRGWHCEAKRGRYPQKGKSRSARNQFRFEFFSHVFNLTCRCFCLCLRDWYSANVRQQPTPPSRVKRAFPARPIQSLPRERGRVSASCRSIRHPVRGG
jgi:hypothetical protein